MGLGDLFAANDAWTLSVFGKGVTANSVKIIEPNTGSETEITDFVFEQDQNNQITLIPAGEDAGLTAQLEISTEWTVTDKTSFRIDNYIWQTAGWSGKDLNTQTVLLHHPHMPRERQQRQRGS